MCILEIILDSCAAIMCSGITTRARCFGVASNWLLIGEALAPSSGRSTSIRVLSGSPLTKHCSSPPGHKESFIDNNRETNKYKNSFFHRNNNPNKKKKISLYKFYSFIRHTEGAAPLSLRPGGSAADCEDLTVPLLLTASPWWRLVLPCRLSAAQQPVAH